MKMARAKLMPVNPGFKEAMDEVRKQIGRKRGVKPSYNELTAEMAQKNFDKLMLKILLG